MPLVHFVLVTALFSSPNAWAGQRLSTESIENVLAVTWQPGFCATAGRDKPECRSFAADRFDATHFSLHGLWPDDLHDPALFPCYCDRGAPRNCGTNLRADRSIDMSQDILADLAIMMPGVESGLHRHQWSKHGSCYEDDLAGDASNAKPDEYFSEAISLLAQLNSSPVRTLFAENIGETVTRGDIAAAFDESFGAGAAERVTIVCIGRGRSAEITELRINLAGEITTNSSLAELIIAAPPTQLSSSRGSCERGRIAGAEVE